MRARWDGKWWLCECGERLPKAPTNKPHHTGLVQCKCGRWWRFDYWALNRWRGDTGNTGLEPHLHTMAGEPVAYC